MRWRAIFANRLDAELSHARWGIGREVVGSRCTLLMSVCASNDRKSIKQLPKDVVCLPLPR